MLAPRTGDAGSGSWPTPTAAGREGNGFRSGDRSTEPKLKGAANLWAVREWPTPRASMAENRTTRNAPSHGHGHGETLAGVSAMWATPVARDDQKTPEAHLAMKQRMGGGRTEATSLTVQAKLWPTPKARDFRTVGGGVSEQARNAPDLPTVAAGHPTETTPTDGPTGSPKADLNPRFVEALMGLPDGWSDPLTASPTDFTSWVTAWSLSPLPQRSASFLNGSPNDQPPSTVGDE